MKIENLPKVIALSKELEYVSNIVRKLKENPDGVSLWIDKQYIECFQDYYTDEILKLKRRIEELK